MSGDVYDITIVGAGPSGLFATFYAGLRQMKTKVIDALEEPGGQVAVLYPEKYIFDVPGYSKILAKDLVKCLVEQAFQYGATVALGERVTSLHRDGGVFELETNKGTKHYSKAVLIAAGVGAFSPNRLEARGAADYEGKGVYYFVKDKSAFRDKRLLIVGGGDSAVDWALNMKDTAKKITLVHRRDVFRAHEGSVAELMKSDVDLKLFYEVSQVKGDGSNVTQAVVFDNRSKAETVLDIDAILVNIGFRADLGPIKDWGLQIDGREIRTNGKMETNIPGVYVAGDVAGPQDGIKLNLIATGYAQAAVAVNVAKAYVDPGSKVFPGHSSEMKR
ncbi:MAG: NAD(P)/FAD-dependent oxidoreductase [Nitrososphaerota archaeon]|jgi:thioredoxin reductase (NADPH)|nr:NAD(P)/FAD-dependent oxidoreductase [Nitrososphaerota archaeon]MDG6920728.1 NAD(P)/FAD-dependent oxidoreductase [Nitrososphaerota archaeon]MDG6947355.1 NAD(P)/FAD-dependent oxidoreductase [Nitrososphaerota archaeon]MDG7011492.1 NAD(P)/FAD-dependent oxidoreductase [Nitrososphaerota archaeon]MDG7013544.1 NAD(P)/FAD-dependent oxidoreductase [Nitrososphaerota archaeon]